MTKRTILITGCSTGIGLDAARTLRDRGWRVFASCRKQADCDRLTAEGFESPRIDYEDGTSIRDGLAEVLAATGGRLDALFNNGAYGLPGAAEDLPTDGLRAIFEANFFGWHELTRAVIPVMRAQGHGRIVMNSSILGFIPYKWRAAYVATKFALEGYSDVLRLEMADTGLHIALIEPGPITSAFRANAAQYFEKWIDWKASPRAEQYRDDLLDQLYGAPRKDRFELPASAVTAKLIHAIEHPHPKPRYYVTTITYLAGFARRFVSTRMADRVLGRA